MNCAESAGHLHALVAKLLHRPVQLLEFDGLFDHGHRADLKNLAQNFALALLSDGPSSKNIVSLKRAGRCDDAGSNPARPSAP